MEFAAHLVLLGHLLAYAAFLGGGIGQLAEAEPEVNQAMLWGAIASLMTGLALMSLRVLNLGYAGSAGWPMLITKLMIALALCVLTISNRRFASIPRGLLVLLLGLGALEAVVGVWWG